MNTPVKFEISKLLKEKAFDLPCRLLYKSEEELEEGIGEDYNWNHFDCWSAPTIAEVVMWLYENHGVWIQVPFSYNDLKPFCWTIIKSVKDILTIDENKNCWLSGVDCNNIDGFDSPTEAYEVAIIYTLKNLIP